MKRVALTALRTKECRTGSGRWSLVTYFAEEYRLVTTCLYERGIPEPRWARGGRGRFKTVMFAKGSWQEYYVDYHKTEDEAREAHAAKVESLESELDFVQWPWNVAAGEGDQ